MGEDAAATVSAPVPKGTIVGRYVVLSPLGHGGMGTVVAAFDPDLSRRVALKLVQPREHERPEDLTREAKVLAKLEHPNVASVYDVGFWEDRLFIAMELVDGGDIDAWLAEGRSTSEIVTVYLQAGRGLAAAHARGVVHRDFKPSNVLVGKDGRARVADFGLAQLAAEVVGTVSAADSMRGLVHSQTTAGGTPDFMAPEVLAGEPANAKSDQYSFCLSLLASLTGVPDRERLATLDVPTRLRRVLARGLATEADERFATMDELLAALEASGRRQRPWLVRGAAVAVIGALVATFAATRIEGGDDGCEQERQTFTEGFVPARLDALQRLLASSTIGHAKTSAPKVAEALSQYADAWMLEHQRVCGDPSRTAERTCLQDRRGEIEAMWSALESGGPDVVEHAMDAIRRLRTPGSCTDPDRPPPPPAAPAPPDDAEAGKAIRAHLDRAQALLRTGQPGPSLQEAQSAAGKADEIGHLALRAEARLAEGDAHHRFGEYADAETSYRAAFADAWRSGHDVLAIQVAAELVILVGSQRSRPEAGAVWLDVGEAAVGRLGWPTVEEADLWDSAGALAVREGDTALARKQYERALQTRARFLSDDHLAQAGTLYNIAAIDTEEGAFEDAVRRSRRVLEIRLANLGEHHPDVALAYNTLGASLLYLAKDDEAGELLEHAYTLGNDTLGPGHPRMAPVRNNLANYLNRKGQHQRAKALYEESLEVWTETRGPDDPDVALAHHNLAATVLNLDEFDLAIEHDRQAVEIWSRALGPDNPKVATGLYGIAIAMLKADRCAEALEPAERALAIVEASPDQGSRRLAPTLFGVSRALACADHHDRALELAERAVAAGRETYGPSHPNLAPMLIHVAYVYAQMKRYDEGRAAAEEAVALARDDVNRSNARLQVARSYTTSDPARARELASDLLADLPEKQKGARAAVESFIEDLR
mgnify:CR=1 FL=1